MGERKGNERKGEVKKRREKEGKGDVRRGGEEKGRGVESKERR